MSFNLFVVEVCSLWLKDLKRETIFNKIYKFEENPFYLRSIGVEQKGVYYESNCKVGVNHLR
jgi:hypothetical protein